MTDFVDWKVKKGQQGTRLLSSRLFRRVNWGFQVEKKLKLAPNLTKKTQNFPIFKNFMQLSKFRQTSRIEMLKTVNKEQVCCPVGFSEELISVFKLKKKLKLAPNLTKNPKFSNFQKFYAIVEISTDFSYWNVENGHQSKNLFCSSVL